MMRIFEMTEITEENYQAFKRLIPQLTEHSLPPTREALERMLRSGGTFIFIARGEAEVGQIIGSATLGVYQSPTGTHGWIEDVVVDETARRQGVGRALTIACIEKARELGLGEVNLTSRPSRKAANRLYQSMGFVQRETNVYRYPLEDQTRDP